MSIKMFTFAKSSLTCFAVGLALATVGCAAESGAGDAAAVPAEDQSEHIGSTHEALTMAPATKGDLLDIALNHPTSSSSTAYGAPASRAVDGSTDGNFWDGSVTHTNNEPAPWWQVTLSGMRPVYSVTVWNRTDCCSDRLAGAVVELLDGWGHVVASKTLAPSNIPVSQDVYFGNVQAASVRVRLPAGGYLSLAEVQVWMQIPTMPLNRTPVASGICWKGTYGRGVGSIPSACPAGQELNGALCYPVCAPGYTGVGPVCWQDCPAGYTDDGAFCRKDASIISADNSSCPWYDVCGLTFAQGCSHCPAGYADDGCTCRRNADIFAKYTYTRGAGSTMSCPAGQQMDTGLCYNSCSPKYDGVGPVCWATCGGDYPIDCGAGCATDAQACINGIENMAATTANAVANLAGMVEGWGEVRAAVSSVGKVSLTAAEAASVRSEIYTELEKQTVDLGVNEASGIAQGLTDAVQTGTFDWTQLDPTGIAAVVAAFNQPICSGT
jgi:hypothetical protein